MDIWEPIGAYCEKANIPTPEIIKQLSMILLCDVWIHATELQQIFDLGGLKQSFCRIREYTFGSPLRPTVKNRISPNEN